MLTCAYATHILNLTQFGHHKRQEWNATTIHTWKDTKESPKTQTSSFPSTHQFKIGDCCSKNQPLKSSFGEIWIEH